MEKSMSSFSMMSSASPSTMSYKSGKNSNQQQSQSGSKVARKVVSLLHIRTRHISQPSSNSLISLSHHNLPFARERERGRGLMVVGGGSGKGALVPRSTSFVHPSHYSRNGASEIEYNEDEGHKPIMSVDKIVNHLHQHAPYLFTQDGVAYVAYKAKEESDRGVDSEAESFASSDVHSGRVEGLEENGEEDEEEGGRSSVDTSKSGSVESGELTTIPHSPTVMMTKATMILKRGREDELSPVSSLSRVSSMSSLSPNSLGGRRRGSTFTAGHHARPSFQTALSPNTVRKKIRAPNRQTSFTSDTKMMTVAEAIPPVPQLPRDVTA